MKIPGIPEHPGFREKLSFILLICDTKNASGSGQIVTMARDDLMNFISVSTFTHWDNVFQEADLLRVCHLQPLDSRRVQIWLVGLSGLG